MYSFIAFLLLCSLILAIPTNADDLFYAEDLFYADCPNNINYTRGSAFQANLDALLSFLPGAAAGPTGLAINVAGDEPDKAYGLAQCRADVNTSDCRMCLDASVQAMRSKCPGQKMAMLIYDRCLIRYSNESVFGANNGFYSSMVNMQNATQPEFTPTLGMLMGNLTEKAAYVSPWMFAVGSAHVTPIVKLYGMAQCTRDLIPNDCNRCLSNAVALIPNCCNESQGSRIYLRSCSIRYELYQFYKDQADEAKSPVPSPAVVPVNGGGHFVQGSIDTASGSRSNRTIRSLLISVPLAVTMLALLLFAVYVCKKWKAHEHVQLAGNGYRNEEMGSLESIQYTLSTLIAATDNFSEQNRLGQGAFGPVYRGKLQNGQEIAVKKLSATSQQGQAEMKNEVTLVAKLQHKNLVRLLGYCIEKAESLLVYEFLSNKSLDKILYGPERQRELSWEQRYKIIYGIGRGLMYLHEDSRLTIIHRDLKPGNILLDADMNPKISDFGLAKLFHMDLNIANTGHIAGTRGYMAPEYIQNGIFSTKSDVFSYGVLVLEVVTGRRPYDDLLKFVWRHWSQGNMTPLLDNCLADEPGQQQILMCVHIGLLCVQDDPDLRPSMAGVVLMLNSHSMTLADPTEPVFAATGEMLRAPSPEPSINQASVSVMEPR